MRRQARRSKGEHRLVLGCVACGVWDSPHHPMCVASALPAPLLAWAGLGWACGAWGASGCGGLGGALGGSSCRGLGRSSWGKCTVSSAHLLLVCEISPCWGVKRKSLRPGWAFKGHLDPCTARAWCPRLHSTPVGTPAGAGCCLRKDPMLESPFLHSQWLLPRLLSTGTG